jgi:type IV pilus assembly protein PilO
MDKPGIMLTVYNLTKKNGLSPGNLNYEEIKDEGSYLTMGMTFSCTGSLENIYALLNQFLTDNPYILALDSINFSEGENGTAANMRLIAYVYKS